MNTALEKKRLVMQSFVIEYSFIRKLVVISLADTN